MHRFFVSKKNGDYFDLDDAVLKHIKVTRLEQEHFLCNFEKVFYECELVGKQAKILQKLTIDHEFKNEVILIAPVIKMSRYEWLLEKAVELGVTQIVPLDSRYTNGTLLKFDIPKKTNRHQEIIKNAAEQSFRNVIPTYSAPIKFKDIFTTYASKKIYLAYEGQTTAYEVNSLLTNSVLIVGPEGGFATDEIKFAQTFANVEIISLGRRILRAETACLYMLSQIKEH
ncbi:16S rRNA (uracil(1498)-N(3))-methyltransferase [Mycoplasmopsis columbinasalis]|uniref:Ribosomal RNA small subunit methyltransferase E n=1 Tax=Mycoplasmopsis columbinasalis TaxID=114880 RepID=A0A449B9F4_9BACT|nr:16S rRNA (uracil(1498)-N(3))-methyltransferase [Mycoplasmopsis columbinasalis]VEU77818.1 RsmE family RNA methyltransferase [Mycoplasmopsis columbinasalis]